MTVIVHYYRRPREYQRLLSAGVRFTQPLLREAGSVKALDTNCLVRFLAIEFNFVNHRPVTRSEW
jgi:hypothetical protein